MRKLMLTIIPIILMACAACEPPPVHAIPPQTDGTIHLEGDSVTFNTYYSDVDNSWFTSSWFCPAATADRPGFCTKDVPATTRLPELVQEGEVDKLVWAYGLNDMLFGNWSEYYQLVWTDLLTNKVPSSTCIVMVKPWVLPMANDARPLEVMDKIRAWMDDFASKYPNVRLVDWKPILEAHPEYSSIDGVHIVTGSGGEYARDAMYREGIANC